MKLYNGDCLIESDKIKSGRVDLILTDLPYGVVKMKEKSGNYTKLNTAETSIRFWYTASAGPAIQTTCSVFYNKQTAANARGDFEAGSTTAIAASVESGDYDITITKEGGATLQGDGEFLMKIRRFLPDFISQTGNTQITLNLRDYPNSSQASSPLGPFTISSSTTKVDTRARARAVSLKIANTSTEQDWKLGTFRVDVQPDGRR